MPERTIEDQLREEYFRLLPQIRRVEAELRAEVQYQTLPILRKLKLHEQLVIRSRVKECESAISALRRRQEGATFDRSNPESYSLLSLKDLAAARVLAFPPILLEEIEHYLRICFHDWISDPIRDKRGEVLAPKYYGYCPAASNRVRGEYQIVSMLTGLFWEVEHSAIYKPNPELKGQSKILKYEISQETFTRLSRDLRKDLRGFCPKIRSSTELHPPKQFCVFH